VSLDALFRPRSVAVVGASRNPKSLGHGLLRNLLQGDFDGPVYPVNPNADSIQGVEAFPSLQAIPGPVDLAVVTVPARLVLDAARDAAAKGVRAMVTITAGFKEIGGDGVAREAELRRIIRDAGIRMVGPNCMGLISTDVGFLLNASFAAAPPRTGPVAFASQSGALGEVILELANEVDIGMSAFVSLGNKTDVGGTDLVEHWGADERTKLILLYLESIDEPERLARVARRITHSGKPILAVKAGRSEAGARAASSHTGSLAGADAAASALLAQAGVIQAETIDDLFTLAPGFAHQPLPAGRRIGILTNAGGPGIMATDAADREGLELATLTSDSVVAMAEAVPAEASLRNPVDILAPALPEHYRACTEAMLADPAVDGLIIIHVSPVTADAEAIARGVLEGIDAARARGGAGKPILASFMNPSRGRPGRRVLRDAGIPAWRFPEQAVHTMATMARYKELIERPAGRFVELEPALHISRARDVVHSALVRMANKRLTECWLRFDEAMALLRACRIPVAPWAMAWNADAAVAFSQGRGPIVLKADSDTVLHRTEHDAVAIDLHDEAEIRASWAALRARLDEIPGDHRIVAQEMVRDGVETLAGVTVDPALGHLLAFGLGGVFVELLKDVVFRLAPLSDRDAELMVRGIRGLPLLEGLRGSERVDLDGLQTVLLRLSRLVEEIPEIREIDLNPMFARASTQTVVDARIRVSPTLLPLD
jgi:acetate---CoA ligase (ADP-forming)